MKKGKGQNFKSYDKLSTNVTRSYTVSEYDKMAQNWQEVMRHSATWHPAPTLLQGANQQPSNLEGSGSKKSKKGRKAQRRRAWATHHGNKKCRKLLDDDETSKTIGQTGLTTTRRRKATDHPTWEAQVYVINIEGEAKRSQIVTNRNANILLNSTIMYDGLVMYNNK